VEGDAAAALLVNDVDPGTCKGEKVKNGSDGERNKGSARSRPDIDFIRSFAIRGLARRT
jgi:hypothetical protein